jgi:ADP-ribosyl-[dinitrogen reductase] hydrolase
LTIVTLSFIVISTIDDGRGDMRLTTAQRDRAAGVLLGQACGDALGVPYEFGSARLGARAEMVGGGLGPYAPGEWSDDTQMAVCIARVASTGADLTSPDALDDVAAGFEGWYADGPADVGSQTSCVLTAARRREGSSAERLRAASRALHGRTGMTAGNGALMRTAIVGLTELDDAHRTAGAARAVAELTHADPLAGDSCILWSEYVRRAVLDGEPQWRDALRLLPKERRAFWADRLDEAACVERPGHFGRNGFTVTALQAAMSAIMSTRADTDGPEHVDAALQMAILIGGDTDTVAAIAGGLLGAMHGVSALPICWRRVVHGWPGLRAAGLVALASSTAQGGGSTERWPNVERMEYRGWRGASVPVAVPHPHDSEVLLGTMADLRRVDDLGVDAVVSLCRVGSRELAGTRVAAADHVECWLVDSDDPAENAHLEFVLDDAAEAVRLLRSEGKRVLLHCVAAQHRTPAVAVRYAVRLRHESMRAAEAVLRALLTTDPTGLLWRTACDPAAPSSAVRS